MDTHILEIVGLPTLHLTADTQIVAGGSAPLEIALVVDNTGSMYGNGGIEALKGAVEDFMDVLESVHAEEGSIRISLVPFSNTVNIRGDSFDWAWMDTEARAEWHGDQFDESAGPVNVFDLYDAIPNVEWGGCVEYRGGGYEVSDAAPTSADPDTLFVPWMIPDDPDFWPDDRTIRGNNRWSRLRVQYLPDDLPPFDERHPYHEQDLTQIRSTGKYNGTPAVFESGTFTRGPNSGCSQTPIIPLQTSISRIRTAVRDLENPQGWGTDHLMGLMWGWRVLSPGEPYDEGAPYGEARKIIIMMTDGELNMGGTTNIDTPQRSYYTGYGFASEARRSVGDVVSLNNDVRREIGFACEDIREAGIDIYTVTYSVSDQRTNRVLAECANIDDHFIAARGNSGLRDAFETIAHSLVRTELRIAR